MERRLLSLRARKTLARENPGATPFVLLALLLFQSPLELTLWKLFELLAFGERSHHQFEDPTGPDPGQAAAGAAHPHVKVQCAGRQASSPR